MKPKYLWSALWLALFLPAVAWRAQNLDAFGLSNDEGVYLMWGRLLFEGFPLYSETVAVQPPLFFEALAAAFRLAGDTVAVGRWAMMTGFALLAVTLSWLAHKMAGWPAAITALLLLSLSPLVFVYSRLAMAELPATGLAVLAVALTVRFTQRGGRGWLVAAGLAFGLSLIFKTLNPFVVAPIGLLLLLRPAPRQQGKKSGGIPPIPPGLRRESQQGEAKAETPPQLSTFRLRSFLLDALLFGLAALLPVVAIFALYDAAALFDQVFAFRRDLRAAIPGLWAETWQQFRLFLAGHWSFWLLAVAGIITTIYDLRMTNDELRLVARNSQFAISLAVLLWLLAGITMLMWHSPLFAHHFVLLLPPLILLGAAFVGRVAAAWRSQSGPMPLRVAGAAVVALALLNLPAMARANQQAAAIVTGGREQEALQLLSAVTQPDDFLMGDSQLLIFMANRRTPPPLGDLALVGIKAGRQTSSRLIDINQAYQSPAVVRWALRLPWLPEYLAWVEQNYLAQKVWDNDHIIHFVRRIPPGEPLPNPQNTRLGDSLALRGYQASPNPARPGDTLQLKLYWQTDAPLSENLTVFTQLLDSSGALAAGHDSQPLGGYFPTGQWPPGEIITDPVSLPLPAELPPGQYTLITGMYRLDTLERLPVAESNADFIVLGQIEIE
ncbi:MAG: hypothetical protein Kow0031_00400 [Anaerolineae bacterium]